MVRPCSVIGLVVLPAMGVLVLLAGCGSSGSTESGSGGQTASGGMSASGGKTGSGGSPSTTGGTTGTGGQASSGGVTGTGGSIKGSGGQASGGASASSGGTTGAGGVASGSGGAIGSGGATGGRSATGGSPGAGGRAAGTGGSAGSGPVGSGGSTGAGGSSMTPGMSAGCGKAPTIASSMYNNGNPINITAAGLQRRYILRVPTNYDNTKPYKLVIAYHARDSNDHSEYKENFYGLSPLSNNTTIFVAPNGQLNGAPCAGTGTGESGCGWPNTKDQDMQLADAVVQQVEENFCIDTNRIFATGWSYGASMSEQTACERPLGGTQATWGVRAVATYAVAYLSNSTNCKATKPVAYYGIHGTCDSVLTYDGSARCSTTTGGEMGGVGIAKTWATVDGCTWAIPKKVTSGAHVCEKLSGCSAGYPVEFCSHSGDHTAYPDNGNESSSWGPAEAWAFLNQF